MTTEFRLPDLAEGVAEAEVVAWRVAEGDRVTEDDPLAEVETDKALVEVPSPHAGRVAELCAAEGETVAVGEVLVRFADEAGADAADETGTAGADTDAAETTDRRHVPAPPSVRRLARERGVDLAGVEGSGPGGRVTAADVERAAGARPEAGGDDAADGEATAPTEPADDGAADGEPGARPEAGGGGGPPEPAAGADTPRERTLATPATRRVADELGVDLDRVPASDRRDGEAYVTEAAVREHAERAGAEGETAGGEPGDEAASAGETADGEPAGNETTPATAAAVAAAVSALGERSSDADEPSGERVPYRGVRRSVGERMARSKRTVPHATHHDSVDAGRLVEVRAALNEETEVHLTYTAFVVRAVVSGLAAYPSLNARLDEEREEIVLRDEYNVGVAVATDDGLVVPVVDDADEPGLEALAARINETVARARERSLGVEDLRGGTFTVSNVGTVGGEYATPIVNHPVVAVLALGELRERPRVVDGAVVARPTLPLSLSIDHRVVDGAVAAAFTNHVMERLREPARLLL